MGIFPQYTIIALTEKQPRTKLFFSQKLIYKRRSFATLQKQSCWCFHEHYFHSISGAREVGLLIEKQITKEWEFYAVIETDYKFIKQISELF
jgi:hypothetical protein